jgi:hypothetical protein
MLNDSHKARHSDWFITLQLFWTLTIICGGPVISIHGVSILGSTPSPDYWLPCQQTSRYFVFYLTALSVSQMIERPMRRRLMNDEFGRKQMLHNRGTASAIASGTLWKKLWQASVMIPELRQIRDEHILYTNPKRCSYIILLGNRHSVLNTQV